MGHTFTGTSEERPPPSVLADSSLSWKDTSVSTNKMKTFVLVAFALSATFGLAASYDCSDSMQSMVESMMQCADCAPDQNTQMPKNTDGCIKCVMGKMGFLDAGEIVNVDKQIMGD